MCVVWCGGLLPISTKDHGLAIHNVTYFSEKTKQIGKLLLGGHNCKTKEMQSVASCNFAQTFLKPSKRFHTHTHTL